MRPWNANETGRSCGVKAAGGAIGSAMLLPPDVGGALDGQMAPSWVGESRGRKALSSSLSVACRAVPKKAVGLVSEHRQRLHLIDTMRHIAELEKFLSVHAHCCMTCCIALIPRLTTARPTDLFALPPAFPSAGEGLSWRKSWYEFSPEQPPPTSASAHPPPALRSANDSRLRTTCLRSGLPGTLPSVASAMRKERLDTQYTLRSSIPTSQLVSACLDQSPGQAYM